MVRSFCTFDFYPTRIQYKHKQNHVETLSRVPCKQKLSTQSHARYSLVEKMPCCGTYLVSQNVPAGHFDWCVIEIVFSVIWQWKFAI